SPDFSQVLKFCRREIRLCGLGLSCYRVQTVRNSGRVSQSRPETLSIFFQGGLAGPLEFGNAMIDLGYGQVSGPRNDPSQRSIRYGNLLTLATHQELYNDRYSRLGATHYHLPDCRSSLRIEVA